MASKRRPRRTGTTPMRETAKTTIATPVAHVGPSVGSDFERKDCSVRDAAYAIVKPNATYFPVKTLGPWPRVHSPRS